MPPAAAATSDGGGEAEVVAALEALGYSSREGREAARSAVADLPPEASLEDRVKEALQACASDRASLARRRTSVPFAVILC